MTRVFLPKAPTLQVRGVRVEISMHAQCRLYERFGLKWGRLSWEEQLDTVADKITAVARTGKRTIVLLDERVCVPLRWDSDRVLAATVLHQHML